MFRTVVVIAALTLAWGSSAAALEPLRKWTVGSWQVSEHDAFCMGHSPSLMIGKTSLMFAMAGEGAPVAFMLNQSWRMISKRAREVHVTIDQDYIGSFPTAPMGPDIVAVKLPAHLIRPLQDGAHITMQFDRASYTFPLRDTRLGLEALVQCSRKKSIRGAGSTVQAAASPPAARSTSGTGFFVSRDGFVLTNEHVVDGCAPVRVTDRDGNTAQAKIAAQDKTNDLALLWTGLVPREIAEFRRESLRLGVGVVAFGFPLSSVLASSGNFTEGIVSATAGLRNDTRYVQITAPVQPGNSGGPLLDRSGKVSGVVSAKLNALNVMLATGGDIPQNVNFAINGSLARNFLESNRIEVVEGSGGQTIETTELANRAQAVSVFIRCDAAP